MGAHPGLLETALAAADAARTVVLRHWQARGFEVERKADATPVTIADREAEAAVRSVLQRAFPEHAIHGEEAGREGAADSPFLWLVDPIDGTRAFVRGYPFFSTQIALMHHGELVLGVSDAPAVGERAWAQRGQGAWLARGGGGPMRLQVSAQQHFGPDSAVSTGNLKSLAASPRCWAALAGLVQQTGRIRGYGDFLHYHLLAEGKLELVLESDVDILDVAALAVIVREAGGVFTGLDGRPPGLAMRSVLAGPPVLHASALALFAGARGGHGGSAAAAP